MRSGVPQSSCPDPIALAAIKKAGRRPTLFYGSILSNLGFGGEYSHPRPKGKEITQNKPGIQTCFS
jgi:hypothetical protein